MKKCIVDVDSTLWDFLNPIMEELRKIADIPDNPDLSSWGWYDNYGISSEEFYAAVDRVHRGQWSTDPFPGGAELLLSLKDAGWQIIIASHRHPHNGARLARWLYKHLPNVWTGIYAGPNKKFLIEKNDLVIDDSPQTIEYALKKGAEAWTVKWPWNKDTDARKFRSLETMSRAVRGQDDFDTLEFFAERDLEE